MDLDLGDLEGRTIWIVNTHGYGKRFIIRADQILTAFVQRGDIQVRGEFDPRSNRAET